MKWQREDEISYCLLCRNKPILQTYSQNRGSYRVSTVSCMKRQREDEISYCLLSRNNNETTLVLCMEAMGTVFDVVYQTSGQRKNLSSEVLEIKY